MLTFGILFFLAGHSMESTIIPLEIAHEHRNYVPSLGVLIPLCYYVLYPIEAGSLLRLRQVALLLLIGMFWFTTFVRADQWKTSFALMLSEVENHPDSARSNLDAGNVYSSFGFSDPVKMEEYYQHARTHFERSVELDKSGTGGLVNIIIVSSRRGKPVEEKWFQELEKRLEFAPVQAGAQDRLSAVVVSSLPHCETRG